MESMTMVCLNKFPVTVHIFDISHQQMTTKFFDMNLMEERDASAAAEMFSGVDKLFIKHGISWDLVTAFGVDKTNANIGEHNL